MARIRLGFRAPPVLAGIPDSARLATILHSFTSSQSGIGIPSGEVHFRGQPNAWLGCLIPRERLFEVRRGRGGNLARVVAAWWLVHRGGMKTAEAGAILGMRAADVSKAIAKVRAKQEKDEELSRLIVRFKWSIRKEMEIGSA